MKSLLDVWYIVIQKNLITSWWNFIVVTQAFSWLMWYCEAKRICFPFHWFTTLQAKSKHIFVRLKNLCQVIKIESLISKIHQWMRWIAESNGVGSFHLVDQHLIWHIASILWLPCIWLSSGYDSMNYLLELEILITIKMGLQNCPDEWVLYYARRQKRCIVMPVDEFSLWFLQQNSYY